MKNRILAFILCFVTCFSVALLNVDMVYAEETEEQTYTYTLSWKYYDSDRLYESIGFCSSTSVRQYAFYWTSGGSLLAMYINNGKIYSGYTIGIGVLGTSSLNDWYCFSTYYNSDKTIKEQTDYRALYESGEISYAQGDIPRFTSSSCTFPDNYEYFNTTVPIFSSQAIAESYLLNDGTVDISDASNYYTDIVDTQEDSVDVPVPKNFGVLEENGHYYLYWEQSAEDLEKITDVTCGGLVLEYNFGNVKMVLDDSGGYDFSDENEELRDLDVLDYFIGDFDIMQAQALTKQLVFKIDITQDINNLKTFARTKISTLLDEIPTLSSLSIYDYSFQLNYIVRNRWMSEDELTRKFSTALVAKIDIKSSETGGIKISFDSVEIDSSGQEVPGSDYNDVYDSSLNNGTSSGADIRELLYFFKEMFICFPDFIFERLEFGIYAMVLVVLFKLLVS